MADNLDDVIKQIGDQIGKNNISNALLLAKKASIQAPNNHQIISYLGYCYWRMGQLDDAIREYETAIALSSDVLEYYYDLIYIHLDNENSNAAENYLKMVREMEPNNKAFLRIETLLLNRKGQYKETIDIIESIMEDHQLDRNDGVDFNILCDYVDAKSAEAFSYYDKANDGYYYLTDLDKLERVKEIWQEIEKYKFVYNDPSYVDEELENVNSLYKKKFKDGGKKLFIVPAILALLGLFGESIGLVVIGLALVAAIAYFVPEPQWKINRSIILGKKTPVDYAISANNGFFKICGVVISLAGAVFLGLFAFVAGSVFSSNDRY